MTERAKLERDLNYIKENRGNISTKKMMALYTRYMNGSDAYILGAEFEGEAFAIIRKHIPLKWCSCQTDHETNNQYLRLRTHKWGAEELSKSRGVFNLGAVEEMYQLYKCNTKKGYNSGYCFEIALFNFFAIEGWKQDNKHSTKGGDIEIDGKQYQAKFVEKESLATITSTSKLINELERRLKKCA